MKDRLFGMIAHLPTVHLPDRGIDEATMRANVRRYLEAGITAMFTMGSSGEFFNLSREEYRSAVRLLVEEVGPRTLKIAGCGSPCMKELLDTVGWLNDSGIDAAMVILPYFAPLSGRERTECIRRIAAECPGIGIIHYNTDYAPSVRCTADDYAALADVSNLWGTKQGGMTTEFWNELQAQAPSLRHFTLDDWLVSAMKTGGYGSFSLLTSLSPGFALRWYEACISKEWATAEAMSDEFQRFMAQLYMPLGARGYNDIAVDKALIDCFGFLEAGPPRPPIMRVSSPDREWAAACLEKHRFFRNTA